MSLSSIPARFSAARTRSIRAAFSSIAAVAVGCSVCTPAEMIARSGTRVTSPVALMSSRVPLISGTWTGTVCTWAAATRRDRRGAERQRSQQDVTHRHLPPMKRPSPQR